MPLDTSTAITWTINGTDYHVWDEGTRGQFTRQYGENHAIRHVRCQWADRGAIIPWLLGTTSSAGGGITSYVFPQTYPDQANWVVLKVEFEGEGIVNTGPFGMVGYERCLLIIHYGPPDWTFGSPQQIGEQELDFSVLDVPMDSGQVSFKYQSDNTHIPGTHLPHIRVPVMEFRQSRYDMAELPLFTIANLSMCSNSVSIFGMGIEKVLFLGGRSKRKLTPTGALNWDVDFAFKFHPAGWNRAWRPGVGWQVFVDLSGNKLFPPQDLNQLYL